MRSSLSITILIVIALLTSCDSLFGYASGDSQEGTVVDAVTDEPINDAFVIGQWGTSGIERTICFHLAMTRSDVNGKYFLPAWRKKSEFGSGDATVALHAYKAGYRQQYSDPDGHLYLGNRLILVKLDDPGEDKKSRITVIRETARQVACGSAGESEKNVTGFYQALYREALDYTGGEETEALLYLREKVEQYKLGYDKASERYRTNLRKLMDKEKDRQLPEIRIIDNTDESVRGAGRINENEK